MRTAGFLLILATLTGISPARSQEQKTPLEEKEAELRRQRDEALRAVPERLRPYAALAATDSLPALDSSSLKKGQIGSLLRTYADPETVWTNTSNGPRRATIHRTRTSTEFTVDEVVDKKNIIAGGFKLWIEGIDASEMTDDSRVNVVGGVFLVKGTKQYETANGGTNTVKHLVVIETAEAADAVAKIKSLNAYRVWCDKSEKHATIAAFVEFKGGKVKLRSQDGKVTDVKMNELSKTDQEWVRGVVSRK
jgi:hypothetical protein